VPLFNEEVVIDLFHQRLVPVMDGLGESWEVVYVNDGSSDASLACLVRLQERDSRIAILSLSRNFGKEIALTAGLDHARGQAVIATDIDLQDPPEVIPELVAGWREGFDIVYAQRRTREGESWIKRATASAFYRVMGKLGGPVKLPRDTGDFRLLSRRALDALLTLRERHRFMKGLFAWVGFPAKAVMYDRAPRAAGSTKWNWWKLWNLSLEGITSFTVAPLLLATYLGFASAFAALVYGVMMFIRTIVFGNPVPGYPSLLVVILFLGGVQLMTLGIIGEYLGRIFNEAKQRPLYIVERHLPSASSAPVATPGALARDALPPGRAL
jgi:glycosyltransferase involved in cell wall biosynthesis